MKRPRPRSRGFAPQGGALALALLLAAPVAAGKPVCGDDVCQGKEPTTCPQDCEAPPPPPPPPPDDDQLLHQFDHPEGGAFGEFAVLSLDIAPGSPGPEILIGDPKYAAGKGGRNARTGKLLGYAGGTAATPYELLFEIVGPEGRSQFGYSAAPAGDFDGDGAPDLAVGAFETGMVYVYSGADTDADGLPDLDLLFSTAGGKGLSTAGDLDGDGCDELLVGTPGGSNSEGKIEVWSGFDGDPSGACPDGAALYLSVTAGGAGGRFGEDVAGGGDLDGDGTPDLVVGAKDAGGTGGVWALSGFDGAPLWPPVFGIDPGDQAFGARLALISDVTGDFVDDIVVGARNRDDLAAGEENGGAVYLLDGATGAPTFFAAFGAAGDQLGSDVSSAGDLDGDGLADLLAGARSRGPNFSGGLVAYSSLTGAELLSRTGPAEGGSLGSAVAGGLDLDGDGTPDLLGSAPAAEGGGKVYLYSGVPE